MSKLHLGVVFVFFCFCFFTTVTYAQYDPIFVTPEEVLAGSGFVGEAGTFAPATFTYTLENYRTNTESVTVTADVTWVNTPGPISVGGSGGTANADVTLNTGAGGVGELAPGYHEATITFDSDYVDKTRTIRILVKVRLCEAVDNCDFVWTTGGDAEWYGQVAMTHDATDAAQSGSINNAEESWIETTIYNPGDLSFWWKVSSEATYAPLEFYINGNLQDSISGNVDWTQATYTLDAADPDYIATGEFILRWRYVKNRAFSIGADAGWLDEVAFVPEDIIMVTPSQPLVQQECGVPCEDPDITVPTITLTGNSTVNVECGDTYTDAGAIAWDSCDGDLTASIVLVNPVDTATPASYTVTYNVSDSSSNAATEVTRTVNVLDTTAPTITLTGNDPETVECGDVYTDAGATAADACEGNLTGAIVTVNNVNSSVVGSYTITYNVSDSAANAATQVSRTVNVEDTVAPVITLVGTDPVDVECGSTYTDAGATATDACDGNLTAAIVTVNPVNTAATGTYTVTYDVSDTATNAATQVTRTVNVVDTTAPTITLTGANPQIISQGPGTYTELNATAADSCDGDITGSIVIDASAVDSTTIGSYTVTYDVSDAASNAATQVARTVEVVNTAQPYVTDVTVESATTVLVTFNQAMGTGVDVATNYTIAGAGAGTLNANPDTAAVDAANTYRLTWSCPGIMINGGDVTITVAGTVEESTGTEQMYPGGVSNTHDNGGIATPPVITLTGNATETVECGDTYTDAGATAEDQCTTDISASIVEGGDAVDTTVPGTYTITYNVNDGAGNAATEVTRMVTVEDTTIPVITLNGTDVTVDCGAVYTDAGATADDSCDGDISASIVVGGDTVDTSVPGDYIITYNVDDIAGNTATEVTRTVTVSDNCIKNEFPVNTDSSDKILLGVCNTYTVSNTSLADPLNWSVSWTESWLDVNITSGTLPAGNTVDLDVCFTADADLLAPGVYEDTLVFTNTDTSYVINRVITLRISGDVPLDPATPSLVDGAADVSPVYTTLSWSSGDNGGCLTEYTVYCGTDLDPLNNPDFTFGPGPELSYDLPLLDESTPYYWQVVAENCCGTAASSPVWQFTTGSLNALVYFVSCGGGVNYAETALQNLEFNPLTVTDAAAFETNLGDPTRNWEIVIVDVQGGALAGTTLDALENYYNNDDGRIIFYHSNMDAWPGVSHNFFGLAGVEYGSSYTTAQNVYVWEEIPMFTIPNVLPAVLITEELCPEFGHYISLRVGSKGVGGYTFGEEAGQAAIVVNSDERIVFNAFRPQTLTSDNNSNAIPDMVELYENQIVVATPYGCDPDETPPEVTLLGANPATLECGDTYESPGVYAWDFCEGVVSDLVNIDTSQLDTQLEGTYIVYYSVTDTSGNTSPTLQRTVDVVDTTNPLISLLGASLYTMECGYPYDSPGAFALDACDGNLTDSIVIDASLLDINTVGNYTVTYSVTDGAGFTSQVVRNVAVADTEAPIITLLGDNPMILECADTYTDPGFTAIDACDGDLSASVIVGGDTVDPAVIGTYQVTYTVTDGTGNLAELTRTVEVGDITPPAINLGTPRAEWLFADDGFLLHECSAAFVEPDDFSIIDLCDGDLGAVDSELTPGLTGVTAWAWALSEETYEPIWVDSDPVTYEYDEFTAIPGSYLMIYVAADTSGNVYPVLDGDGLPPIFDIDDNPDFLDVDGSLKPGIDFARLVRVEDTTLPEVTLLGDNPLTMECSTEYVSPGATASDTCDGDLTSSIGVNTDELDTGNVGSYPVYYSVIDMAGNTFTATRTVNVEDTTIPILTLLGEDPMTVECSDPYLEPGATAADDCDGDITASIITAGDPVDSGTVGTYIVTYNVTDGAGNAAVEITRTVDVVDTTIPVITLLGDDPTIVECGDAYTDAGAEAADTCDGDITANIVVVNPVDTTVVGTYIVTYNVTDTQGNVAEEITRSVEVVDTTPANISLGTFAPENYAADGYLLQECSIPFVEPDDFSVVDVCDLDLGGVQLDIEPGALGVTAWVWVLDEETHAPLWDGDDNPVTYAYNEFTALRGDYLMIYVAGDVSGNVYPALDENGLPPIFDVENNPDFLNEDGTLKPEVDFARLIRVEDTTAPEIELLGDNPLIMECADVYVSPGILGTDTCDGDISANVDIDTSGLDIGNVGEYPVLYSVTDASGNTSEVLTRTVQVIDTTIPAITLVGEAKIVIECGDPYEEQGATATDACDGDISESIVIAGDVVNTSRTGTYVVTYNVTDSQENDAEEVVRVIRVEDTQVPVITVNGEAEVTVECGDPYEDPGASATDYCDGDLTGEIVVAGDVVDVNTVGTYVITFNVTDGQGHIAEEVTRTVIVEDTTIPVITRLGDENIVVECADAYDDPGATADDHCDGDITDSIVVNNPVDTAVVGTYTVTYNVTDGQGNVAVEVTRTVEVVNTTLPVITLPATYVPIDCGKEFDAAFAAVTDALTITAANPCGDLTADIRVTEIKVTYPKRGDAITYTVDSINTTLIQEGKIAAYEGEYTGTLKETITLFQHYFLFKPAIYEITYAVQEPQPTEVTQIIRIDDKCQGPLGCYSCDSCAGQRPLPNAVKYLKRFLSDWLLVGSSILILVAFNKIKN